MPTCDPRAAAVVVNDADADDDGKYAAADSRMASQFPMPLPLAD